MFSNSSYRNMHFDGSGRILANMELKNCSKKFNLKACVEIPK